MTIILHLMIILVSCFTFPLAAQTLELPAPKDRVEIALDAFAQLPRGRGAQLSPDGSYLAFKFPSEGRDGLVIQGIGALRERIYFIPALEGADLNWFQWVNSGRLIISYAYFQELQGQEMTFTQMVAVNYDGSEPIVFFKPKGKRDRSQILGNIRDNVIDFLPDDPDHILVAIDGGFNGNTEVRKVNVNTGRYGREHRERAGIQNWFTDPSGKVRYGYGYLNADRRALILENGRFRSARKMDWFKVFSLQDFKDEGSVAYATSYSPNTLALYTMDVDAGKAIDTVWANDDIDLHSVIKDTITDQIIGVRYVDDYLESYYVDKEWRKLQRSVDKVFKATKNAILGRTADTKMLLVDTSSDVNPGVLYFWDRNIKQIFPVLEAMPGIVPDQMAQHLPVTYEARDGLKIPGYITFPVDYKAGEKWPTVLLPHGGPHARSDRHFDFEAQFLANRGYIVFQPNFRGSDGYGLRYEKMGRKQWGGKMQDDLTDAANWLISEGYSDPEKVCIVGGSYGGYAAMMGAIKTPDLFACAASLNGVMNMPRLIREDKAAIGGKAWIKSFGLEGAKVRDVSPYHRTDQIKIPILIAQAKDDSRVPEEHGKMMASRLKSKGVDVTYLKIKKGGHSLVDEKARKKWLGALEKFLDKNIGQ